jgi:hypothetical protein
VPTNQPTRSPTTTAAPTTDCWGNLFTDKRLAFEITSADNPCCEIEGTLADSLTTLTNLQNIHLDNCKITGKLPEEGWEKLSLLTTL